MPKVLKDHHKKADLVIGGAGFAGLALAIALRQGLGEAFTVTVADPALASVPSKDPRASAIAAAARRLFETIGVWDAVAGDAQPMLDMVITDSKLDDTVRPTFLSFGGDVEEGEPFAHMVENRHLIDALVAKAKEKGTHIGVFAERLLGGPLPWTRMRQAYALLRLCDKYGDGRVEAICQTALAFDVVDVTRVKRRLKWAAKPTNPADTKTGTGKVVQLTLPRFARPDEHFETRRASKESTNKGGE